MSKKVPLEFKKRRNTATAEDQKTQLKAGVSRMPAFLAPEVKATFKANHSMCVEFVKSVFFYSMHCVKTKYLNLNLEPWPLRLLAFRKRQNTTLYDLSLLPKKPTCYVQTKVSKRFQPTRNIVARSVQAAAQSAAPGREREKMDWSNPVPPHRDAFGRIPETMSSN